MRVQRISYASPGFSDFFGLGKIFEIILEYIKFFSSKKERAIDLILKQKDIEEKEQNILQRKIENLEKLGLDQKEILELIGMESKNIGKLTELINLNQITELKVYDPETK